MTLGGLVPLDFRTSYENKSYGTARKPGKKKTLINEKSATPALPAVGRVPGRIDYSLVKKVLVLEKLNTVAASPVEKLILVIEACRRHLCRHYNDRLSL